MNKYKIMICLITAVLTVSTAYSQENPKNSQAKTVSGTVTGMDFVGSTISIMTGDGHQKSFFVPGNAVITRDTHDIGLMDVKASHPVTIKYETSAQGEDIVDSIVDDGPSTGDN